MLRGGGLAMVGSRNVDAMGETFTRKMARLCAESSMPVVSGGARGVDQISMESALDAGGTSIGILADNLLKKSLGKTFRKAIAGKRFLLISPYHPEAPFKAWAAMGRNKLIYAMADFALVVSSDHKKGGTWAGATEELKRESSIPVFTRIDDSVPKGNKKLLEIGAVQWPASLSAKNMNSILSSTAESFVKKQNQKNATLFDQAVQQSNQKVTKRALNTEPLSKKSEQKEETFSKSSVYDLVLPIILKKLSSPASVADLAEKLDVQKVQLTIWLKKALAEKKIKKLTQPVRYARLEK